MDTVNIILIIVLAAVAVLLVFTVLHMAQSLRHEERLLNSSAHTLARLIASKTRLSHKLGSMLVLLLMVSGVHAQIIDQRLTRLVEKVQTRRAQGLAPIDAKAVNKKISVEFNADGTIRAFSAIATLKAGAECPTAKLEQMGIKVRYAVGDMVGMTIPADKLMALEQVEEISFVKADEMKHVTNLAARKATHAYDASVAELATAADLPKAYTGEGVVLGIIDTGIDYNHVAFCNADGTTRVRKAIVLQGENTLQEYTCESDIKALTTDFDRGSHGSHTAAVAGGSETGNSLQGVAPQTDLILCGLGKNNSTNNINECIIKIFDYAKSVGKPAVVSISLGICLGLHDGSDDNCKLVGQLTENGTKQGRAVVVSSSNDGANWQSIIKTLPNTTEKLKTVLGAASYPTDVEPTAPVTYTADYYFYASDYKDFDLELKLVDTYTGTVSELGKHVLDLETGAVADLKLGYGTTKTVTGSDAVTYSLDCQDSPVKMDDPKYRLVLIAQAGHEGGQTIKMMCAGEEYMEPCFDAPNDEGEYNFAANGWTKGNGDFAFSTTASNDGIISVGAYVTTTDWVNYKGIPSQYNASQLTGKKQVVGEICDFSSYGIDDNGMPVPTLIAPGKGLISACNNYDVTMFKNGQPGEPDEADPKKKNALLDLCAPVDKNGRKNWYLLAQGTSMSCPHAAGIVALWMQAKPTLTVKDIKDVMKETCVNDDYTTNTSMIPSGNKIQAGYGKIDALAGLKKILGSTGIETVGADGHREATPSTMYSVDAPVYNMMGQRVDKSQKGLVIYKGRKYVNR